MGNANTLAKNDVSLLWLLKNSKTVYRAVLAAAQDDNSGTGLTTAERVLQDYAELKSLVFDTADTLTGVLEEYVAEATAHLVAESEYGEFRQDAYSQIAFNAHGITETNTKVETLENAQAEYALLVNGQIRRGFIEFPENSGQFVYGIAVSQDMAFDVDPVTEEEVSVEYEDGHIY